MKPILILSLLLPLSALAQFVNINSRANAVLGVASAAISSIKKPIVPIDTISGVCFYREGSCNGAELVLLNHEEREVFRTSLTSVGNFTIPRLKKDTNYTLKLDWKKHKLTESKIVSVGEFVEIQLSQANIKP